MVSEQSISVQHTVNYVDTLSGKNNRVIFPGVLPGEAILSCTALALCGNS